jgi:hypothetical protein
VDYGSLSVNAAVCPLGDRWPITFSRNLAPDFTHYLSEHRNEFSRREFTEGRDDERKLNTTMKTIRRAAWSCLLLAVTCGCATKKMEIHYVQVEACQRWSDQYDNPALAWANPLVVFRLVSIKNTSAQGTPNITFDLYHLFLVDSYGWEHPEFTLIPWMGDIGQQLAPGQSVHFPLPSINGLFAIQDFDTTADVQGAVFYLNYESASDESVFVVRDPSPSTFHPFCGKTALSALQ